MSSNLPKSEPFFLQVFALTPKMGQIKKNNGRLLSCLEQNFILQLTDLYQAWMVYLCNICNVQQKTSLLPTIIRWYEMLQKLEKIQYL